MIGHPGAIWIPSPFYSHTKWPYDGGKPKWIIIHGTASGTSYSAQSTGRDFQKQGNSTHYVVGYDGTIVQCVDEANPAWGNGVITGPSGTAPFGGGNPRSAHDAFWDTAGHKDPNGCTISIEHSKSTDNQSQLSTAQQKASFALVAGICQRWGIPRQLANASGGITGHYSIDPVMRSFCPGPYPFQNLVNFLGGSSLISSGPPTTLDTSSVSSSGPTITTRPERTYIPVTQQIHDTLIHVPGFYGIALALDEAEQFPGWIDLTQPVTFDWNLSALGQNIDIGPMSLPDVPGTFRSLGATVSDNFMAFTLRSGIATLGFALLLALMFRLAIPIIEKGASIVLPLAALA